MDLGEAQVVAEQMMERHGLTTRGWKFGWDRSRCRAGCCRFGDTRVYPGPSITLSRAIIELNDRAFLVNVMLHEIAHALAGISHNHDGAWREIALRIGMKPQRAAAMPLRGQTVHQWAAWYMRRVRKGKV
jgi:hypothetical protein